MVYYLTDEQYNWCVEFRDTYKTSKWDNIFKQFHTKFPNHLLLIPNPKDLNNKFSYRQRKKPEDETLKGKEANSSVQSDEHNSDTAGKGKRKLPMLQGTVMKLRKNEEEQQTPPPPKRLPSLQPTAICDEVGLVMSLFHRIQALMKIVDGSTADHSIYETMAYDEEEDPDVLTVEEQNKLEWIMAWDTGHNLDWNWWYIRLYFQEHRRHLVDRFQATLNLMGSGDTLEETKTDAFNAPETADDFCEKKKLQDEVENLKLNVTKLEATVDAYKQAAIIAACATATEVFTLVSHCFTIKHY
jgi:hypothetical protein